MDLLTERCSQALAAFAESIQNIETWQEWNHAQQALEGDAALMRLFSRYEELSGAMRRAKVQAGGLSGEQVMELARVREGIINHPLYIRRQEASDQLTRLFQGMNSLLTKRLRVDFAAMAAPPSGCCG
jgi:cell fate (sporulation/competence/biofilm development) regulator YlbF (YheA/YmcA/DUF963 family)